MDAGERPLDVATRYYIVFRRTIMQEQELEIGHDLTELCIDEGP